MHRMVYISILQGAWRELSFDINLYHFTSIYYFGNLNTHLKRTHLGTVMKRKGMEEMGREGRKEREGEKEFV